MTHEKDENGRGQVRCWLLRPSHRKRPHQHRQRHLRWLPAVKDDVDKIGREQCHVWTAGLVTFPL